MLWVALGMTLVMIGTSWVEFQSTYNVGAGQVETSQTGENPEVNLTEGVPDAPDVTAAETEDPVAPTP